MNELKPCPFCGGKAIVKEGYVYADKCMRARCENGCVATKPIMINHPSYTQKSFPKLDESTRYTAEQAAQVAAELWNARTKHENGEWLPTGMFEEEYAEIYECSVCRVGSFKTAYCPHCGTRMNGGES